VAKQTAMVYKIQNLNTSLAIIQKQKTISSLTQVEVALATPEVDGNPLSQ
jgi:hypothetical protein